MNDVTISRRCDMILLSKREAILYYDLKNVSNTTYERISLREARIEGLSVTVVDSSVIDELKPGEEHALEAKVILPGNLPFEFDALGKDMQCETKFNAYSKMTRDDYDNLPNWL